MSSLVKFSAGAVSSDPETEFTFPNIWEQETHPGFSRLLIGSQENPVDRILDLCQMLEGPFGILYVLLVSRTGKDCARYQSSEPVEYDELERFIRRFQSYFEQDGRHDVWVTSIFGDGQFVLDKHNITYAYGDLERIVARITSVGYVKGKISLPYPHTHHYNAQFDDTEEEIMGYWKWLRFPLAPSDDP